MRSFACRAALAFFVAIVSLAGPGAALERTDLSASAACDPTVDTMDALSKAALNDPFEPPKINGQPIEVDLGIFLQDLSQVVDATQTFEAEAFAEVTWCDPRWAFDETALGTDHEVYHDSLARDRHREKWWPDLQFINITSLPSVLQEEFTVWSDGTVVQRVRLNGTLRSAFDFSKFPFDQQDLQFHVQAFSSDIEDVQLVIQEEKTGYAEDSILPYWRITGSWARVDEVMTIRQEVPFSQMTLNLHAERFSAPYVYRLLLPLVLIVIASWSVFWLRPTSTGRFGVTFTTILTIVTFNFYVSRQLPEVQGLTYIEMVYQFSFSFLLLVVLENLIVERSTAKGQAERAQYVDEVSRFFFPFIYFVGLLAITWQFGIFDGV
ncbi:MAG: hypothetical protein ACFB3T_07290 [Geminicoccaceae bacterium]